MYVLNVQGTLFKVIEFIEFFTPHRTHSQNVHQLSQICYMSTKHIHVFLIVEKDKFQCLCTCVYAFFFLLNMLIFVKFSYSNSSGICLNNFHHSVSITKKEKKKNRIKKKRAFDKTSFCRYSLPHTKCFAGFLQT